MLNCQKRACLRSGLAREGTMKRSLFRYAELSELSLLEVWLGERRDHEVSLYGPQKKQQKRKQKRNINEKENNKVKKQRIYGNN